MTFKSNLLTLGVGIGISALSVSYAHANENENMNTKFYVSGVASNDSLNIRDIDTFKVLTTVKNGDTVIKIKDLEWKKGWSLVKTSNGTKGICNAKYLSDQKTNKNSNIRFTSNRIELRTGAGNYYRIYKIVPKNTEVEFISNNGDWAKVKFEGRILYCPKYYIVNSNTNTSTNTSTTSESIKENSNTTNTTESKTKIYTSSASVTTSKSSANSVYNAKVALSKLNGYTVNPNDTFSFLKAIGPITRENGYVESTVLKNGVKDTGIGGGVCLASTTVFNAMIDAGIEPLQRRNHSLASAYVSRGLDAMISTGSSDLSFVNKTGKKLVINTKVENGYATVTFSSVGDHKSGYTYKARVELYDNGSSAKTYLQTIKDGKVVSEKLICKSHYLN